VTSPAGTTARVIRELVRGIGQTAVQQSIGGEQVDEFVVKRRRRYWRNRDKRQPDAWPQERENQDPQGAAAGDGSQCPPQLLEPASMRPPIRKKGDGARQQPHQKLDPLNPYGEVTDTGRIHLGSLSGRLRLSSNNLPEACAWPYRSPVAQFHADVIRSWWISVFKLWSKQYPSMLPHSFISALEGVSNH